MKIFNRKLLKRVKSLENYLSIAYDADFDQHDELRWADIARIKERLDKLEGKKK